MWLNRTLVVLKLQFWISHASVLFGAGASLVSTVNSSRVCQNLPNVWKQNETKPSRPKFKTQNLHKCESDVPPFPIGPKLKDSISVSVVSLSNLHEGIVRGCGPIASPRPRAGLRWPDGHSGMRLTRCCKLISRAALGRAKRAGASVGNRDYKIAN